ncbi:hypothetical protein ABH924_005080 [Arthrobacter sp. GAS37]|uniref:hypothetical protein n=1 Tax=Arthrobacter sp. GAS37 TaxID=3156261 RepID=UPI003832F62D
MEEKKFWGPPRSRALKPVVDPVDPAALVGATKAPEPLPVFVVLDYDNGETHEIAGFAYGWTRAHVLVSVPWPMEYYEGRKEIWVEASRVRRRTNRTRPAVVNAS